MKRKSLFLAIAGLFMGTAYAALNVGDKAPEVSGQLSDGTMFRMSEWLDKAPLVLYFYPKNDTPGCTTEACAIRDDFAAFRKLDATVFGISYDSVASHKKFIEKYKLPFLLISDANKSIAKAFGVSNPLFATRSTFIIGKDGTILYANPSVNPKTHSQEVRDALAEIKKKT